MVNFEQSLFHEIPMDLNGTARWVKLSGEHDDEVRQMIYTELIISNFRRIRFRLITSIIPHAIAQSCPHFQLTVISGHARRSRNDTVFWLFNFNRTIERSNDRKINPSIDQKSKIQNPKTKIQNQKSKIKNQKSKVKSQKSKLSISSLLIQSWSYFTQ
jgi:hypothetical protein